MRNIFLFFCFLFCVLGSKATHIIGGYFNYEQLSTFQYKITLTVYKDCKPFTDGSGNSVVPLGFDNIVGQPPVSPGLPSAYLSIYTGNPGSGTYSEVPFTALEINSVLIEDPDSCLNIPVSVCVQKGIYSVTLNLPFANLNDIYLSYQRCCRNPSSVNVDVDPFNTGIAIAGKIPKHSNFSTNSNPYFAEDPPLVFCLNNDINFDLSGLDLDGDSLSYELTTPLNGSGAGGAGALVLDPPYGLIDYYVGYSGVQPIPGNPSLSLNPTTGLLTGSPIEIGAFIIGIKISEFRDGVLVSETIRDIRIFIFDCGENQADFEVTDHICDGIDSFEFISYSSDVQSYLWDFGLPGDSDTSNLEFPKFVYSENGNYMVTFIANFGLECQSIDTQSINFRNTIDVDFTDQNAQCIDSNSFDFMVTSFDFPEGTDLIWDFGAKAIPLTDTGFTSSNVHFTTAGIHVVTLNAKFGSCETQSQIEVEVVPKPHVNLPDLIIGCLDMEVEIAPNEINESYSYQWFIDGVEYSIDPSFIINVDSLVLLDMTLIVTNGFGCEEIIEKEDWIEIKEFPTAGFELPDTTWYLGEEFSILNLAENFDDILYEFGDGDTSIEVNPTHTFNDIGTYTIVQKVDNGGGCYDEFKLDLIIRHDHTIIFPNVFTPNFDGLNDTFYPLKEGIKSLSLEIFDRWGKKVYDGNGQKKDQVWDGRYPNGNPADEEVYNYFCTYITELENVYTTKGIVLIVK